MCLYPKLIYNKRYTNTIKNGGNIPPIKDLRTLYVPVNCGRCIECRKQASRDWQVRLLEDIKDNRNGKFVTLTFSNEKYSEICHTIWEKIPDLKGYELDNQVCRYAVKHFRERHRKKYGKSGRRWLVTELGHQGTENIHLHGIIWTDLDLREIEELWSYGYVWKGKEEYGKIVNYVNEKTVGYITKYVSKQDLKHPNYKPIILTSPGIGANYVAEHKRDWKNNEFRGKDTDETYKTRSGHKIKLPIYWRNKIYEEDEKEELWIAKLEKNIRWVRGEKYDVSKDYNQYWKAVDWHRRLNAELKYGSDWIDYDQKEYEEKLRELKQLERITKAKVNKHIENSRIAIINREIIEEWKNNNKKEE